MTFIRSLSDSSSGDIIAAFDGLVRKAAQVRVEEQGVPVEKHQYKYQVALRYLGQAISIPVILTLPLSRPMRPRISLNILRLLMKNPSLSA